MPIIPIAHCRLNSIRHARVSQPPSSSEDSTEITLIGSGTENHLPQGTHMTDQVPIYVVCVTVEELTETVDADSRNIDFQLQQELPAHVRSVSVEVVQTHGKAAKVNWKQEGF